MTLKTLAQEKRSQIVFVLGLVGWVSCFYRLLSRNIWIFFPMLTMAVKRFAHTIRVHYRDLEHAYVYWIWLRGAASYVIERIICGLKLKFKKKCSYKKVFLSPLPTQHNVENQVKLEVLVFNIVQGMGGNFRQAKLYALLDCSQKF